MSRIIHTGCPYAPFLKFALICMTLNPVHQPFNMAACLPVQRHELILVAPGIPPAEVLPEHLRNMVAVNVPEPDSQLQALVEIHDVPNMLSHVRRQLRPHLLEVAGAMIDNRLPGKIP
jgi:hypothetical protein